MHIDINFFIIVKSILNVSTAPDKNPENIKIQGHLPHQMEISWEVCESVKT